MIFNVIHFDDEGNFFDVHNFATLTLAFKGDKKRGIPKLDQKMHPYQMVLREIRETGKYKKYNIKILRKPIWRNKYGTKNREITDKKS